MSQLKRPYANANAMAVRMHDGLTLIMRGYGVVLLGFSFMPLFVFFLFFLLCIPIFFWLRGFFTLHSCLNSHAWKGLLDLD